jgi:hypothetical protein
LINADRFEKIIAGSCAANLHFLPVGNNPKPAHFYKQVWNNVANLCQEQISAVNKK